ncbi:MAG: T9SS type A sorting domain-containing protein [Bacteroidales bacterium]|nr:T9SS type A sorting domain-containing protein [Bacteroidales bacterium]
MYNNDIVTWNLQNFYFDKGVTYAFPETILSPGAFLIVAKNSASMQNTFNIPSQQWTEGSLDHQGEPIVLKDHLGFVIDSVYYHRELPWDTLANGHGPSLELCDPNSDNTDPANWRHALEFQTVNATGDSIWASPLAGCSYPPTANFTADNTVIHLHDYVTFTDESSSNTTTWEWIFDGGTPSTFSGQNPPPIKYNAFGLYDVTLRVSNIAGHNTLIKSNYIDVGWVGIPKAENPAGFSVYPNPSSGKFKVVLNGEKSCMIRILDPIGNIIMERSTRTENNYFDHSGLTPGIYIVQVTETETNRSSNQKLVIQ